MNLVLSERELVDVIFVGEQEAKVRENYVNVVSNACVWII